MDKETLLVVFIGILAFSQFVTMLANVGNNQMHKRQIADVERMREIAEIQLEDERILNQGILQDMRSLQVAMKEVKETVDLMASNEAQS